MLSLIQEMIDSDQQNQILTLQLENDELKTEMEIAYRELHLLRKRQDVKLTVQPANPIIHLKKYNN